MSTQTKTQQPQTNAQYLANRALTHKIDHRGLTIDKCKAVLPLPALMDEYEDGDRAKSSAHCPFHDDKNPSFSVNQSETGQWLFHCHAGCGSGDEITYVAMKEKLDKKDAIRRYREWVVEELDRQAELNRMFCCPSSASSNVEAVKFEVMTIIEASELLTAKIAPPNWVVENLLCEGITIMAGKPKIGKSWMWLDIALCIISGRDVLGRYKTNQGEVLYLALEDNAASLQQRLKKLCGSDSPVGLRFITATEGFPILDKGGMEELEKLLLKYPKTSCIIIDTLQKIKPVGSGNRNCYENDVAAIAALHKFALTHHLAVVLVHHLRKSEADDVFDTMSGSLGLSGSADTNIVIRSNRANGTADLYITGRSIEYQELAISFNKETAKWTVMGTVTEVKGGENRQAIREVVQEAGKAMSIKEIKDGLDASGNTMKWPNIKQTLRRMATDGQLKKEGINKYSIGSEIKTTSPVNSPLKNSVTGVTTVPPVTDVTESPASSTVTSTTGDSSRSPKCHHRKPLKIKENIAPGDTVTTVTVSVQAAPKPIIEVLNTSAASQDLEEGII